MARKSRIAALRDLPAGRSAVIAKVDEKHIELMELGFVPGAPVKPTHSGLGGDPRVYELDGTLVALRLAAARHIFVTLPEDGAREGD
jgi:Fe2+ transport system protein FeoA